MTVRYESKVVHRRPDWQPGRSKSRVFQHAVAARRFVDKLIDGGRFGPVSDVRLYRRVVGPWEEVELDA